MTEIDVHLNQSCNNESILLVSFYEIMYRSYYGTVFTLGRQEERQMFLFSLLLFPLFSYFFTNPHSHLFSSLLLLEHRHKLADTVPPPCSALSHVPPGWVPPEGLAPSPPPPPPVSDRRAPPVDRESLPPFLPTGTTCEFVLPVGDQTNRWITRAPFRYMRWCAVD